jgi:hypothetical protein
MAIPKLSVAVNDFLFFEIEAPLKGKPVELLVTLILISCANVDAIEK